MNLQNAPPRMDSTSIMPYACDAREPALLMHTNVCPGLGALVKLSVQLMRGLPAGLPALQTTLLKSWGVPCPTTSSMGPAAVATAGASSGAPARRGACAAFRALFC